MARCRAAFAAVAVVCLLSGSGEARASVEKVIGSLDVPKVTAAPAIDGSLDDPAWKNASTATLAYDLRKHQPAADKTTFYMMTDGAYLYVGVDARQAETIRATEHTNGVGLDTDDEVQVDLWPNGTKGFMYKFTSTPIGTHYQFSTENNLFEPEWSSAGRIDPGGYVVTMKIPLNVMHGTASGGWRVQLIRYVETTNTPIVWSFGSEQGNFNDVNYSGELSGLPRLAGLREKPRVGIYGLGSLASQTVGGSTSRMGADISIPIVSGTAFVSTLHPDYSDVEIDQQTISPTAFARYYQEVRPFFSQGGNFGSYPDGICINCGISELYTPAIPTPRDGYAIEGERGLFNYVGFDAVGAGRVDASEALNYKSPNQENALDFQGTESNQAPLDAQPCTDSDQLQYHDTTDGFALSHDNLTDLREWIRYSNDSGSCVLDGADAQRYDVGVGSYSPTSSLTFVDRKAGEYFSPVDGLVMHPDVAGWQTAYSKEFNYPATSAITAVDFNGNIDRYHDHTGELDQTDNFAQVEVTTRTLFAAGVSTGSSYDRIEPGDFIPVTQEGAGLGYNNDGSTPTNINFNTGHFGIGPTDSWSRSTTLRLGARGLLSLEADDTEQFVPSGPRYTQWLERASVAYQETSDESIALGIRRIIGTSPAFFTGNCTPLDQINCATNAWNLSGAYRRKFQNGELYLVYGDAALLSTSPQFIIKYVRYFGADKGT